MIDLIINYFSDFIYGVLLFSITDILFILLTVMISYFVGCFFGEIIRVYVQHKAKRQWYRWVV